MNIISQSKSELAKSFNYEFHRLFDRFFDRDSGFKTTLSSFDWTPTVDVMEKDKSYLLKVDLPGVDPKDIDIATEDGMLTILYQQRSHSIRERPACIWLFLLLLLCYSAHRSYHHP